MTNRSQGVLRAAGAVLLACAGGVSAQQSQVSLYGVADMSFNHIKSGSDSGLKLTEGGDKASRFGIRGTEPLGGGLAAFFTFEGGVSLDTGAGTIAGPGFAFTRQAYVGMSGDWGQTYLGRVYTPLFSVLARVDPLVVNPVYSHTGLWTRNNDQAGLQAMLVRADNAINYKSPAKWPVSVHFMYSAGEATQSALSGASGRTIDFSIGYASGPLWVAYSRQERKSGTGAAPVASPATSTNQMIAGDYRFGALKLGASYGTQESDVTGSPAAKLPAVYVTYSAAPAVRLTFGLTRRNVDATANDQTAWAIGADYDLSKRTRLYARWLQFDNGGTASVTLGGVPVAAGVGDNGRGVGVGIRHDF